MGNIKKSYSKCIQELESTHQANEFACFDLITEKSCADLITGEKLKKLTLENDNVIHTWRGRIVSARGK